LGHRAWFLTMLDDAQKQTERIIRVSFEPPLRKKSSWRLRLVLAVTFLVAASTSSVEPKF
jgi:hypothetical protein